VRRGPALSYEAPGAGAAAPAGLTGPAPRRTAPWPGASRPRRRSWPPKACGPAA